VRRPALWQQEPTAIMAGTTAAATRTNTAPGFARVNIRIERANSGALGGKGLMRPGLGQLIGRPLDAMPARLRFDPGLKRPAALERWTY
jgi:hypothetical protein